MMLLCCAMVSTANAQNRWLPRYVDMSTGSNITGANRTAAIPPLEAIERLVKQVPELAHPDGFEIGSSFTAATKRRGPNDSVHPEYVTEYRLHVAFYYPKRVPMTDPNADILFVVNADDNAAGWLDAQGRHVIVEEGRWPKWPYSIVTYGSSPSGTLQAGEIFQATAWFTVGGEFPWIPMSREDYYNAVILSAEGKNGEKRAAFKKATEKTGYERWLEEAPKRKQEREEVTKGIAQVAPAEAAKLRAELEKAEREAGENFKKSEGEDRERAKTAFKSTDDMRAELNRMTPAQRKLPAIIDNDPSTRTEWMATGASMRDRDTVSQTVHRVFTPNYDFWRARKSPVEVRTIAVHIQASDAHPPVLSAIWQTHKKFDWKALAALVDQPGKP